MIELPETHVGDPQAFCLVAGLSDPGSGVLKEIYIRGIVILFPHPENQ